MFIQIFTAFFSCHKTLVFFFKPGHLIQQFFFLFSGLIELIQVGSVLQEFLDSAFQNGRIHNHPNNDINAEGVFRVIILLGDNLCLQDTSSQWKNFVFIDLAFLPQWGSRIWFLPFPEPPVSPWLTADIRASSGDWLPPKGCLTVMGDCLDSPKVWNGNE